MAKDDLLSRITHRRAYQKQNKKLSKTTAPKHKKVRYNKTVQITEPIYNRLREYGFRNDIPMAQVVTQAVKHYLDNHKL